MQICTKTPVSGRFCPSHWVEAVQLFVRLFGYLIKSISKSNIVNLLYILQLKWLI